VLGACAERAYAGPFIGFLEEEVMRLYRLQFLRHQTKA
jgi:hypothetical protein